MNLEVKPAKRPPKTLAGRCVSHGKASGIVLSLVGRKTQYYKRSLAPAALDGEVERLRTAIEQTANQLKTLIADPPTENAAEIFDAHLLILESSSFSEAIENVIRERSFNAEWAVKTVADTLSARQREVSDRYIGQRFQDIEDVAERVTNSLIDGGGNAGESQRLEPGTVIAAAELLPSTLAEFRHSPPAAIITEHGGWTSHTFILAREMGIPAVAGIKRLFDRIHDGDRVLVDAENGVVTLDPDLPEAAEPIEKSKPAIAVPTASASEVILRVNLDDPNAYARAAEDGARGIGLIRSEYLFPGKRGWPEGERQFKAYSTAANAVGTDGACIRTFDFGLDQITFGGTDPEKNPALGLRAIRLGLARESQLRTQIRSIIRANSAGNLSIVIPMIAGVKDIKAVKTLIDEECEMSSAVAAPSLGAMIELPSAVLTIEQILKHVDFVCIGTNDLVQYTLGVDRDNENLVDWYQTLHPAILRSIRRVAKAAADKGVPASVCGEMASSPFYVPLLVGLGIRELSVKAASLRSVGEALALVDASDATQVVESLYDLETADSIEASLASAYAVRWPLLLSRAAKNPKK